MYAAPRRLQVAAIQVQSDNGRIDENLARAEPLVAEAATRGAELILCPEFLAAGYVYDDQLSRVAARFAAALGIPVVMANKVSAKRSWTGLPLLPGVKLPWRFHGYSSICDGEGHRLAYLEDKQGALVAEVTLGKDKGQRTEPPSPQGYWSFAPALLPRAMGNLLLRFEAAGKRSYRRSKRRLEAARQRAANEPTRPA